MHQVKFGFHFPQKSVPVFGKQTVFLWLQGFLGHQMIDVSTRKHGIPKSKVVFQPSIYRCYLRMLVSGTDPPNVVVTVANFGTQFLSLSAMFSDQIRMTLNSPETPHVSSSNLRGSFQKHTVTLKMWMNPIVRV